MAKERTDRLNSLLKEVLAEVIRNEVRDHKAKLQMTTVTNVEITKDLHHAKVFVSIIGTPEQKAEVLAILQGAAGFIAITASRKVVMRFFPELTFKIDDTVDKQMRIDKILDELAAKRKESGAIQAGEQEAQTEES